MRLLRRIGMGVFLVLAATVAVVLLRNPNSNSTPGVPKATLTGGTSVAAASATAPAGAPAEAGMMAYIDPETGDLTTGPAPAGESELDAETANAIRHDDAGLKVVTRADGSKVMNLQGRYQHVSILRIDDNGNTSTVCTDNETAAEHNLHAPVATPHAPAANANAPAPASNAPEVK